MDTSLTCLLINSTVKFVEKDENVLMHSLMIAPKSDTTLSVPGAVLRPSDPGHSFGLQAKFFAIFYVNLYEFLI